MSTLGLILLLLVLLAFWSIGLRNHDTAIATARETCRQRDVQFLDGTAALQSIKPDWTSAEGPVLQRTYTFDYSEDGIIRRTGCIIMRNSRVTAVLLDA
ncbi:MAG: DUF3301 domain-containing protein [Pseudomonadota bacterium]